MKRVISVVLMLVVGIGFLAGPVGSRAAYAQDEETGEAVNLIVQSEGSIEPLVELVESIGGTVNFAYQNVPAMAVTIPVSQAGALAGFPGVINVEKDRLVYLKDAPTVTAQADDTPYGKRAPGSALSFKVGDTSQFQINSIDPATIKRRPTPLGFANFGYTGAEQVWEKTNMGKGSIVAVVDTGTAPNACLAHAVIGAPGFPEGYNATGDGIPANSLSNHSHGTIVASVIASSCYLDFSSKPDDPLYQAISTYLPYPVNHVPILGQAPSAQIYPVKVFRAQGEGTPTSVVLDGLDHLLTLKKNGLLDVDIVNLSFGGPTLYDGRDTFDRFIKEMVDAQMLVVAAAGNAGPILNSIGSPATSVFTIAVGALDYAISSRVFYEYYGLVLGPDGIFYNGDEGPRMGMVMRPSDETRVANFSSRGPLSDGRAGPDMVALGTWNFQVGPADELSFVSGTSFSTSTVAGAAALLNAYWEDRLGKETAPGIFRKALLLGANPDLVGAAWQDLNEQGFGALDIPAAFNQLIKPSRTLKYPIKAGKLQPNVLDKPIRGKSQVYESGSITLQPSEAFDAVFQIDWATSKVTIEIYDILIPDNSDVALWPNSLEVHVQNAKRSDTFQPVYIYWYPFQDSNSLSIQVEDGPWLVAGIPWAYQPMEPGLMKVSLAGDYSNQAPISFKLRILRENERQKSEKPIFNGNLKMGEARIVPVKIKSGVETAVFDLEWHRDWRRYPTSDIDMLIYGPDGSLVSLDGATLSAPERAVIADPTPGTYQVYIFGTEIYKPDTVRLYLKTE